MALSTRKLGLQGLEVSEIGLGCMALSAVYGSVEDREAERVVQRALDLRCSFFDTAEAYGPYRNEVLLGKALAGRRHEATIATKFGFRWKDGKRIGTDSRPEHIRVVVEKSLRRLNTDRIDLLYQHRVDPAVPIEDVAGTVGRLIEDGKVLYFGLSEAGESIIRRAHAVQAISALQSEYSLWERNVEPRIIPLLRELGIGLVAFCPLGRGFLAGHATRAEEYSSHDYRSHADPRFAGGNFDANLRLVSTVRELSAAKSATPAQLALAWLLHAGDDIVPIPGTKRPAHLEQNIAAATLDLTPSDLEILDGLIGRYGVSGSRYNDGDLALINR